MVKEMSVDPFRKIVEAWLDSAHEKLTRGALSESDLEHLRKTVRALAPGLRQRLLYLHAKEPSVYAEVVGMAEHEPVPGQRDRLRTREAWPYATVQEAMAEGWQVIHFPNQMAPFDDREVDFVGYEFILQKMEAIND